MRVLYDIEDMLVEELKKISRKEAISQTDLDNIDKLVDIIKDIETICAMKDYGYSEDNYSMTGSYNSYAQNDYSGRRGRDSMGRYTSRDDGYDHNRNQTSLIEDLQNRMRSARSEEEKESLRRAIDQLKR